MKQVTLKVTEEQAKELYPTASKEMKTILESSLGKKFFLGDVTERIKSYEDACLEKGIQPINDSEFLRLGFPKDEIAYRKLKTITDVLNEGWVADVYDSNIARYYPWFYPAGSPSAFAFCISFYDDSLAGAGCGSRLHFKSEELSDYAAKQFLEIWKNIQLK